MTDYLVRVVARDNDIRGLACVTTELVREACRKHNTSPVASIALGRALSGAALMGALLKTHQQVALKFEGNGPLGKILVEGDSNGAVRGYVANPQVNVPLTNGKLDVANAVGRAGLLTVMKDLRLKEPYRGVIQLYTSEIGEDLAYYFAESEQVPSAVSLGVYVERDGSIAAAGGFLVQSLPSSDVQIVERIIQQIKALPPMTELLRAGTTPEKLLEWIFGGITFDVLEKRVVALKCSCSRERVERALASLGRTEIESLINDNKPAEVTCEYCREHYVLSREELEKLLVTTH